MSRVRRRLSVRQGYLNLRLLDSAASKLTIGWVNLKHRNHQQQKQRRPRFKHCVNLCNLCVDECVQKVDPESVSKDSVLYRATHKASILGFDPDEEKRKALFGVLSQEDMDRVKALFNHLLDQSEIGEGMLEVDLISEVASAMPIDFGAYMGKDNEDKALNLEEAYGYFNACKRQNRQGFEDALSAVEEDEGVLEPAKTEASASK